MRRKLYLNKGDIIHIQSKNQYLIMGSKNVLIMIKLLADKLIKKK